MHGATIKIKIDTVLFSHHQTYFQSNEPLHCLKELLSISLHFTLYLIFFVILVISLILGATLK